METFCIDRFKDAMPKGATTPELRDNFCSKKVLFYIERTMNSNCVIYEANIQNGALDPDQPVKAYWILYARVPIVEEGLNMIERNTAYGITFQNIAAKPGHYEVTLASLPSRPIEVFLDAQGIPQAIEKGTEKELLHIFVETETTWGILPRVVHVDVYFRTKDDKSSGEAEHTVIKERIKNN